MKISSTKFLIFLNILGSILIMSSPSWMGIWLGMEMTSMTLPPMIMAMDSSILSKINAWKYYMIQCYSSSVFLLSVICLPYSSQNWMYSNVLWTMVIMSMLFKMGILPFHGWLFHMSSSLPWSMFLILSTIQKIGPLVIISESYKAVSMSTPPDVILSVLISMMSISGIWINSIRYFLVTSSIINTAWMIASSQMEKFSFIMFMLMYFFHIVIVFLTLEKDYSNFLDSIAFSKKKEFPNEMMKYLMFLSMIGMPPLLGFFMKLMVLEQLIFHNQLLTVLSLTFSSAIIMLMYLQIIIMNMNNMRMINLQNNSNPSLSLTIIIFLLSPAFFFFS